MPLTPLITENQIRSRVSELAVAISDDAARHSPTQPLSILVVANGALFFAADLIRQLTVPVRIETICVSSYGAGTESNGVPDISGFPATEKIRGNNVLVIDDIVDTGNTLASIRDRVLSAGALRVSVCVLLNKPSRRTAPIEIDYSGFSIEDKFAVGYGLDFNGDFRTLPFVAEITG